MLFVLVLGLPFTNAIPELSSPPPGFDSTRLTRQYITPGGGIQCWGFWGSSLASFICVNFSRKGGITGSEASLPCLHRSPHVDG